jgi:hypothetical protein
MEAGSTILTPKEETRTIYKLEKSWEHFTVMPRGAYWLISCPEEKLSM